MKIKFRYSVSTNTIWASFDNGEVEAESVEEARAMAIQKLTEDFKKVNDALKQCDSTKEFSLEFDKKSVVISSFDFFCKL